MIINFIDPPMDIPIEWHLHYKRNHISFTADFLHFYFIQTKDEIHTRE